MRIRLTRNYSGPRIASLPAGEYDADDVRLAGRAEYLVGIEVAEWVDTSAAKTEVKKLPPATETDDEDEFHTSRLTITRRKKKAAEDGD